MKRVKLTTIGIICLLFITPIKVMGQENNDNNLTTIGTETVPEGFIFNQGIQDRVRASQTLLTKGL